MPGLDSPFYPWPYIEGVTMAEAANDLAFISTGMYGKPLPPQDGGPIRLTLPWKYGFKSAKAIGQDHLHRQAAGQLLAGDRPQRIRLLGQREPGRVASPLEPGAASVCSGPDEMVPTVIYNGYGDFVASLYVGLQNEKLFM